MQEDTTTENQYAWPVGEHSTEEEDMEDTDVLTTDHEVEFMAELHYPLAGN